ncbi:MAG: hypothetical protein IT458_07795 [Planctomycetes bacterium]|nr:hypothetical protein [Planctomycetota bacterium]
MRLANHNPLLATLMAGLAVAGAAAQGEVLVTQDISVSTTWTSNNTYNLQKQIYVLPGATLTIQAGTVIASTTNVGGSLAVTRGGKIFIQGTDKRPVIMTSKADVATWTGGNPRTGAWREAANEWGNLTLMGRGYISENAVAGNTPVPSASNVAPMEGLVAAVPNDPNVLYGGGNDDDDSGSISYLSLRYGGKVVALNVELNGLSLGGIGRETDIHHVEIMNNVDDGIEIWGGTVNLKYFSIWNIGDDSLDIDQGWRGKAQFGLIVQGHSLNAAQGSGVGDNAIEMDGAEDSDWQPVTTATLYNLTVVGQPFDGDRLTAWRDNARVQLRNCIFMDGGEEVVGFDNKDGDGANGYGFNGTLSWENTWTTDYSVFSTVNAPANPAAFYRAQSSGKLIELTDSVFFNNAAANAYTVADARGVFAAANNNQKLLGTAPSPITALTRGAAVVKGGKAMVPVTSLDPRPANAALTSAAYAPRDGFFSSARYRGAFAPGNTWLAGWTASEAYGLTPKSAWNDVGNALAGTDGDPVLAGAGTLGAGAATTLSLSNARQNAPAVLVLSGGRADLPVFGGILVPDLALGATIPVGTDANGRFSVTFPFPGGVAANSTFYFQVWVVDTGAPALLAASNGVSATTP